MDPMYSPPRKLVELCQTLEDDSSVIKALASGNRVSYNVVKVLATFTDKPYTPIVKEWFDKIRKPKTGKAIIKSIEVKKFDEELGLVLGYAIISKENGEPYFDLQGDYIPEDAMLKAATDFMENSAAVDEMHDFKKKGTIIFAWPLTTEIAKVFDIDTPRTGLLIAMKPNEDILAKFKSGEYTGFSIGGERVIDEPVEE